MQEVSSDVLNCAITLKVCGWIKYMNAAVCTMCETIFHFTRAYPTFLAA